MFPVINTFIEFRQPPLPRRASCPPEFFKDAIVEKALKREKKKRAARLAKITKKWGCVVEAALKIDEERTVKEIRALVPRLDDCSPKPRCSLHSAVYPHFVRRVFPDPAHALFLEALGVIRR